MPVFRLICFGNHRAGELSRRSSLEYDVVEDLGETLLGEPVLTRAAFPANAAHCYALGHQNRLQD